MKHLTEEQNRIWNKYYSHLTADELMQAVIDSFVFVHSTKPGVYSYYDFKAAGLQYRGTTLIPGAIWRSQSAHRQVPEPKDKDIQKLLDRYYGGEFMTMSIWQHVRGRKFYSYYSEDQSEPLTSYLTYHPLILKRINELTEPLLYGQREDVQALVKEYQAGNTDTLPRIKSQLGGIIYKAQQEFSYIGNKEAFTNLAGKFNKKIPRPDTKYSNNSPIGDAEDQRLMLVTEPFKFNEADLQAAIDRSLTAALDSYRPDQGAKFKTWFYKIFEKDLIDLYRHYQMNWKNHGDKIKTFEEYQERLQNKIIPQVDYTEAAELLPRAIYKELTDQQLRWIALFLKMLPDTLTTALTAQVLGISEKTEYLLRQQLQSIIISYSLSKRKKAAGYKEKIPEAACKDSSCRICPDLFPNMNIEYRFCYAGINLKTIKNEKEYIEKRPAVKCEGGYYWPAAKAEWESKEKLYCIYTKCKYN
jgi:hypothetical protein